MKVLLVNPEFPDTYWSFRHALRFQRKRSAFPPLALLTISAMLPREWERQLIDLEVTKLRQADIDWADMVFVSGMLVQKDSLHEVVKRCKDSGKRVAVGGPYVSTCAPESLPDADHIFFEEAEQTLLKFLDDLEHEQAQKFYKPVDRPQLTLCPVPDFPLINFKNYSSMLVQYSRGCPFNCEFCDIIEIYGRVPRTKSNQQVLAELDALWTLGWRGTVFFVDDNFIGNKKNVRLLMPELIKWQQKHRYPFSFLTEASINLAEDEPLLEAMRQAGFTRVFIGIETPVEESLKEAQKTQNRGNLLGSVEKVQSYGMEVMAGFIVGFDNDPPDIIQRQIAFIQNSGIPLAMAGILTALPNTQLWRRLKKEGRLKGESTGNNTDYSLNFFPKMDEATLVEGYKYLMRYIYQPRQYYQRALDSLRRTRGDAPQLRQIHLISDIAALIRVTLRLGVIDRGRWEFWRFIIRGRKRFVEAMKFAAVGYHFRRLNEAYTTE